MNRSRRWIWATPLLAIAACRPDTPVTVPPSIVPATVTLVSGNQQAADPQDLLPDSLIFKIANAAGDAIPGVRIDFSVPIGGGSVPTPSLVSDSSGRVATAWLMGAQLGVQTLEARVNDVVMATATATTCDPSDCFPLRRLSGTLSEATLLKLATYDSSGQAVHPDIVRSHGTTTGFWLAITPYPGGNTKYENPSIFRSTDAAKWAPPPGVANPVAQPDINGYLSDPDIVVNTDQRLWLYYRSVINSSNVVKLIRSADGVKWTAPVDVITVPSHELVSPAVVRGAPGGAWQMWSVNSGERGCTAPTTTIQRRVSSDGIHWAAPTTVSLVQPGQAIWHIDVQWIAAKNEYWAVYNTYAVGTTCATNSLYIARSSDGVTWTTYPSPIATAGVIDAFQHLIYRSTFMTDPKAASVTLWMSGAKYAQQTGYTWQTATVTLSVADLFVIASRPNVSIVAPRYIFLPPPERDVGPGQ